MDAEETMTDVDIEDRNLITVEVAERNRSGLPGGYTFNAYPPSGFDGRVLVFACVRLGDHAHVEVYSGRSIPSASDYEGDHCWKGYAGHLVLRWPEWLLLREMSMMVAFTRVAEIENPTTEQVEWYVKGQGTGAPHIDHQTAMRLILTMRNDPEKSEERT